MRIALVSSKGGVGKSLLSLHLAGELSRNGRRVLLVDTDTQSSCLDWYAVRESEPTFPVVGVTAPVIHRQIEKLSADYDDVVMDGSGRDQAVSRSVVLASDLVLLPVTPGPFDVWSVQGLLDFITEAESLREDLKVAFLVNRKIVGTAIGRDLSKALSEYGKPVLDSHVCQRVIFPEAMAAGLLAREVEAKSPGALEVEFLAEEIQEIC